MSGLDGNWGMTEDDLLDALRDEQRDNSILRARCTKMSRRIATLEARLARVLERRGTGKRPAWPGVWSGRHGRAARGQS